MGYDEWLAQKHDEHFEDDFEEEDDDDDFDGEYCLYVKEDYQNYLNSIQ